MAKIDLTNRGSFGSKFGIIAAAAGSAIGLGNIWRFPYVAGENGGAAFLLIYILFILAIGIPVMLSEFIIGRNTQRNPFGAFRMLTPKRPWFIVGIMGILAAFFILGFYGAVGGWTMEYLYKSVTNQFAGKSADEIGGLLDSFFGSSFRPVFWQLMFMGITVLIVMAGVEKGIEKYTKILMPLLLVILILIVVRSVTLPNAGEGLNFLFKPDFSKINAEVIFSAMGQAFFSLSIGMGTLITYGSYINKKDNLGNSAVIVSFSDTFIAILAGVAIFPAVFAFNIEPQDGPGLVFKALPNIFQQMAGGYFFSILFFLLLTVAALTSSISVLEVVVAFIVEQLNIRRKPASVIGGLLTSALGVLCALSFGRLSSFTVFNLTVFDLLEFIATKILLPLGGFFIVIFLGWVFGRQRTYQEISNNGSLKAIYIKVYMVLVRYLAPIAILIVFLDGIGLIDAIALIFQ